MKHTTTNNALTNVFAFGVFPLVVGLFSFILIASYCNDVSLYPLIGFVCFYVYIASIWFMGRLVGSTAKGARTKSLEVSPACFGYGNTLLNKSIEVANGYTILFNDFWGTWQVGHPEIAAIVAEFRDFKDALQHCENG